MNSTCNPPSGQRTSLRFAEEAKIHFAFLESVGFRCVSTECMSVRYESAKLAIDVYHDRLSYEISLSVSPVSVSKDCFSLSEVMRLVDRDHANRYKDFAATTTQSVAEGLRQMAVIVRVCLASLTQDTDSLFVRLKEQGNELKFGDVIHIKVSGRDTFDYVQGDRRATVYVELLTGPIKRRICVWSIQKWNPPHETEVMSESEKDAILSCLQEYFSKRHIAYDLLEGPPPGTEC